MKNGQEDGTPVWVQVLIVTIACIAVIAMLMESN